MSDLLYIVSCISRYYRVGSRCEKCDQSCELCTGPGPESCRACLLPLLELQGTKLCVERCPQRFYQLNDFCKQCHISCQTCTGTAQTTVYYSSVIITQHKLCQHSSLIFHFCILLDGNHVYHMCVCLQMPRLRDV